MASSTTVGIFCAILAGIIGLVLIGYQLKQHFSRKKATQTEQVQANNVGRIEDTPQPAQVLPVPPVMPAPQVVPKVTAPVKGPEYSTTIRSKDIVAQLKAVSPLQTEATKQNFLGKRVEWTLYFSNMMMKSSQNMEITLLNENNDYPMVSFLINLDEYPQVSQLRQGMQVIVRGEIAQIFSLYIVLRNASVAFTPASKG